MLSTSLVIVALSALVLAHPHSEKRAQANVITSCSRPNTIAITFDDGPYIYGGDIVDMLASYKAKATFFVNGKNWRCIYDEDMVKIVKKAYNAGHQIASHTWEHKHLKSLGWDAVHHQMWKTEEALEKILGVSPAFMRPPYGEYDEQVRAVAGSRNQTLVLWDFDSGDTDGKSTAQVRQSYQALANRRPTSVLTLNHETVEASAHASLLFYLGTLQKKGYSFVTVAECLDQKPYKSRGTTNKQGTRDASWHC